jgi:hypothetical protein
MALTDRQVHSVLECPALRNTLLALLAVATVMVTHGLVKLVLLPFRVLRGLFRHSPKPARVKAG